MKRLSVTLVSGLGLYLSGCDSCEPPTSPVATPTTAPAVTPPPTLPSPPVTPACVAPTIDLERSLVIHDPTQLADDFRFKDTLQAIIDTSGSSTPTTPATLLQTMLDSFDDPSFPQPISGKTIPVDPRPAEKNLVAADLLDPASPFGMVPIGLFNRFDLAPADGSNCGEYRIVYARRNPPLPFGRFLMIFEARLKNPNTAAGLAGCQPVAKFWADLSNEPDQAARITKLKTFYFTGLPGLDAVIRHENYGMPLGQVRTNLFIQQPWMLREHRTDLDVGGAPIFSVDTVKETPLVEWYRAASTLPSGITAADQQAFRADFLNQPVCNLVRPDRANPSATAFDVINGIGAEFAVAGNDFQSISQGNTDDPTNAMDPAMSTAIDTRLTALGTSGVSSVELLNRAGAMTCGGCHDFSKNKPLGGGHSWPESAPNGFVHITENGTLSPALTDFFLPRRSQILARAYCNPTPETSTTPPCPAAVTFAAAPQMPQPKPAPVGAAPLPTTGLSPALIEQLTRGRTTPSLRDVDAARLGLLAAVARRSQNVAAAPVSDAEAKRAKAMLEDAVQRARAEEQALPGAFVPVRRTH